MCVNSDIVFIWKARELYRKKPYLLISPLAWIFILFDVVFAMFSNGKLKGYSLYFLSSKDETEARKLKDALLDPRKKVLYYRGSLEVFAAILWYPFFAEFVLGINVLSFEFMFVLIFVIFPLIILWGERPLWRKAKRTEIACPAVLSERPSYSKDFITRENHIVFIDLSGKGVKFEEIEEIKNLTLLGSIGLFLLGYPWRLKQKMILKDGSTIFLGKKLKETEKIEGTIYMIKASILWFLIIGGIYLYLQKSNMLLALFAIFLYLWLEEK